MIYREKIIFAKKYYDVSINGFRMGRLISVEVNSTLTVMINAKVVKYFNRITGNKCFTMSFFDLGGVLTLVKII